MEPLLKVKDLTVNFTGRTGRGRLRKNEAGKAGDTERMVYRQGEKEFTAVDSVSFRLYPHEVMGIVGGSGSGKSTVARAVTRLLDVSSGEIFLNGREITRAKGNARREIYRRIQMVFQSPAASFDPRRKLGDSIGESLKNSGMPGREIREEVKRLLQQCGLPEEYMDRYPHEVSGGECQRAAIARALAIRPEILICDEATSALDVIVQKQIMDLLAELKEEYGMSYLFISHDLALVQDFCDRVIVMHNGKVVEEGETDEVILNPRNVYTRRLIEAGLNIF